MTPLKECPFCGSYALLTEAIQLSETNDYVYCWMTMCEECGAGGPEGESKEDAEMKWNQRRDIWGN